MSSFALQHNGLPEGDAEGAASSAAALEAFHPAVGRWFTTALGQPTAAQARAWPAIRRGSHALVAAPTGSGKTLAAFLAALDDLVRESLERQAAGEDGLPDETRVVYVSPLKALSNDVHRNLELPLEGIEAELAREGLPSPGIHRAVRTGDTTSAERARMVRKPPHVLVTTPETLYILLGSEGGRRMLSTARTVIVDEIHSVAGNKRGSHLALTLERLDHLAGRRLTRIGLSATQKPVETVARFLVGAGTGESGDEGRDTRPEADRDADAHADADEASGAGTGASAADREEAFPPCEIVDVGHRRALELHVEVPESPLEAVMSHEVWGEIYDRLAALVREHRTTLVFVNTRRLAERVTRHLAQRLASEGPEGGDGSELVAAHHGSLSKEQRLDAEQRLKEGRLSALVATASLELGIDIGSVDLVCQIGSTRSMATLLQRVGRSGHQLGGVSRGRVFPLTRDELVECAALLDAVRRGELDRLSVPEAPLDVLAQQVVAAVADEEWEEDALFALVGRAWPYRHLPRKSFDAVVEMLAQGFATRRGRRGAYLHHDAVNRRLRGRRGARLTAITSGGAIPDTADYRVLLEPEGRIIGSVNEDFAVESMAGDVFQLGNASWRILKIERGQVRVEDARGEAPNIPFWFGEAPGRSEELSDAVSRLRVEVGRRLEDGGEDAAVRWLVEEVGVAGEAAVQLAAYLAAGRAALGVLPSRRTVVAERFFDEAGDTHLVIHAPFGSRVNKAWGLALRKRFCRTFNFELQAAAGEDAIVLSLGPTHSFPLETVFSFLASATVRELLVQALLDAPLFGVRWRWNASRSLALPRMQGGRRVPPQLLRHQAEDLLAVVFPDQLACLENVEGDREVPDHPLVEETLRDCLTEAMDVDGLEALLAAIEAGEVTTVARDLNEPSPLAHEILNANPYAFLDDAPLEERRTQAVVMRRWLDPRTAADLGALDRAAIDRVREEARPEATDRDELHDVLVTGGWLPAAEVEGVEGMERTTQGEMAVQGGAQRGATSGNGAGGGAAPEPGAADGGPARTAGFDRVAGRKDDGAGGDGGGPSGRSRERWPEWLRELAAAGRAALMVPSNCGGRQPEEDGGNGHRAGTADAVGTTGPAPSRGQGRNLQERAAAADSPAPRLWVAAERLPELRAAFPGATLEPEIEPPPRLAERSWEPEKAVRELLRSRLEVLGPVTASALAAEAGLDRGRVERALAALEAEGAVMQGRFTPSADGAPPVQDAEVEWCERRLLARIHRYTLNRLRREIEPVGRADLARFLLVWQKVAPEERGEGPEALAAVLEQLAGFSAPAAAWEGEILPARVKNYDPAWLDALCLSGRFVWCRATPPAGGRTSPIRTTPITFLVREELPHWRPVMPVTTAPTRDAAQGAGQGATLFRRAPEASTGRTGEGALRLPREPVQGDGRATAGKGATHSGDGSEKGANKGATLFPDEGPEGPGDGDAERPLRQGATLFPDGSGEDSDGGATLFPEGLAEGLSSEARQVAEVLARRGASFFADLAAAAGLLPTRAEGALAELVATGLVTSDSFTGLRSLLVPSDRRPPPGGASRRRRRATTAAFAVEAAGRWSLLSDVLVPAGPASTPAVAPTGWSAPPDAVETIAWTLLARYGVVFRALLAREDLLPPWRELLWTLRRLEARGEVRGGRFVGGFSGEQFALPEAVARLRSLRRRGTSDGLVAVSGADPLNLAGVLAPGDRLPALTGNRLLYRGGIPLAVREAKETRFLAGGGDGLEPADRWQAEQALLRTPVVPALRPYLG